MRSISVFALALATVAISSASLITIDDFASMPQSLSVNTTGQDAADRATGGTTFGGGTRAITLRNVVSPTGLAATFEIDNGAFGSHGLGVSSLMSSWYGTTGFQAPNSPVIFGQSANPYALPGLQGFEFDWLGNDKPVNLITSIYSYDAGSDSLVAKTWSKSIAAGGAQTISLGAGDVSFNGGGSGDGFSLLVFRVESTTTATDWAVGKFSAVVPEPASMAVLGLGLAALKRRRAKK